MKITKQLTALLLLICAVLLVAFMLPQQLWAAAETQTGASAQQTAASKAVVASQPDAELDSIPEYSALPLSTTALLSESIPSWMSDWATKGSYETADYIVVMGSGTQQLFHQGGQDGKGQAGFNGPGENSYTLDTSGTSSRVQDGYVYLDSNANYNMTGIGSITGCFDVRNLDYDAKVKLGIYQINSNTITVDTDSCGEISCDLPDYCQDNKYVYYENIDPSGVDDGCQVLALNGFKMNKREYYVTIAAPDALQYSDGAHAAAIDGNDARMYKKMHDGSTDKSKIPIVYSSPDYPQQLVGYQLVNLKTGKTSPVIKLDNLGYIVFNQKFISNYEKDYFFTAQDTKGKTYCTVNIKPVMAKVAVESFTLEEAALGTIKISSADSQTLYKGDTAVFEADQHAEGAALEGVYVKARQSSSDQWIRWTQFTDSDGKVRLDLDQKYDVYTFQGVYSVDADILTVEYAAGAADRGQLLGSAGVAVAKSEYVINDYYMLSAKANAGYVTQWSSNGRVYYGDVFYYQLDGNADNNRFTVDFIETAADTADIKGTLSVTDANLHNSALSTSHLLAYTEFSTTAGKTYSGRTDEAGSYTIQDFTGVPGGIYSMAITYGDLYCYTTFTFGQQASYNVRLPQFGSGIFFPAAVAVTLDGAGQNASRIQLRAESQIATTVSVFNQVNSPYTITAVELKYYGLDAQGNKTYPLQTLTAKPDGETDGNYSRYLSQESAASLQQNTRLYVEVVGSRTITVNGEQQTVEVRSGEVNSGYEFITPITDTAIPILDDIPITPGAQNAISVNLDDIEIPFIGTLDLGLNGRNGGFFVRQIDPNDPSVYYALAGFSINPVWTVGTPADKYAAAQKTNTALDEAQENSTPKGDTSEVKQELTSTAQKTEGASTSGQKKEPDANKVGLQSQLVIYPTAMVKFGFKLVPDDEGDTEAKLMLYQMAFGVDEHVVISKPLMIYGVPCYATIAYNGEQYIQAQQQFDVSKSNIGAGDDKTAIAYDENLWGETAEEMDERFNFYFAFPLNSFNIKAGVGFSNLVGAYAEGKVNFKLLYQTLPELDAGGALDFGFGLGADALIFNANATINLPTAEFGNHELYEELQTIDQKSAVQQTALLSELLAESMKNVSFALPARQPISDSWGSGTVATEVLEDNAFRGTNVKLVELGADKIMAFWLADNGAAEGSANFLNVASAISNDGGQTWGDRQWTAKVPALQFGIKEFELNDRLLLTWSEGDLDSLLQGKDPSALTPAQMAELLNGMELKGCCYDKTSGTPLGEAFSIAANTGVAMSALEAVQDAAGTVYVYYQRNNYDSTGEITLETLLQQDHTLACAVSNDDGSTWTSHIVKAQNDAQNQNYRITEVMPFAHNGIIGEVLVLDRDGQLAVTDETSGALVPSSEDRQIFLRFYANADGTETTALVPLTGSEGCAQHVQLLSDADNLYLFWNQDGRLVYLSDFAVTSEQYAQYVDKNSCPAVAVVNTATHEVTIPEQADGIGYCLAADAADLNNGSFFNASMSQAGDVLLSWIGNANNNSGPYNEQADGQDVDHEFQTNEIFGVMLTPDSSDGINSLQAVGSPVALTAENSVLGKMDSVCLADDSFLLAFTRLDGESVLKSSKAAVRTLRSSYEPQLLITDIRTPDYPLPGSTMTAAVTVRNNGLQPLNGLQIAADGVGSSSAEDTTALLPGEERTIDLQLTVPADFSAAAALTVTASGLGEQADCSAAAETTILYDSYFVPAEMARIANVPDTANYLSELTVTNIGNAPGNPVINYLNYVPGSDDENKHKQYEQQTENTIAPGASASISYELQDTLAAADDITFLQIRLGDGYDQSVEGSVPAPQTTLQQDTHSHEYQEVITKATPEQDGQIIEICTICEEEGAATVIARPETVVMDHDSYAYSGFNKKPELTVKDRTGAVIASEHYTVSYPARCKNVGQYTVTVTFKGDQYSGQLTADYVINPRTPGLLTVRPQKQGFTAWWLPSFRQAGNCQLQYSTDSSFAADLTTTVNVKKGAFYKKVSGLPTQEKYYVRLRSCQTVDGTEYYSDWSRTARVAVR